MLYIRADGNPEIGTGHIMRCLSIADALQGLGEKAVFFIADESMEAVISGRGYDVICLHSEWANLNAEIEKMVELVVTHGVGKLLIDSYYVTQQYLQELNKLTYLIYMDDLNMFHYPCDMLVNYNCYADKFDYTSRYPDTSLLLGCHYAPLREEFQDLPHRNLVKIVKSVLITTGGTAPHNVAGKIVKIAKTSPGLETLEFHITAGHFNAYAEHEDEFRRLATEYEGIIVHRNVQSMSRLMLDCDIAISAGGSTLYELCACGTPTIAFSQADNQIEAVARFGDSCMISAGDFRASEKECLGKIIDGVRRLAADFELRRELSEKAQRLVDGRGARRLAAVLKRKKSINTSGFLVQ